MTFPSLATTLRAAAQVYSVFAALQAAVTGVGVAQMAAGPAMHHTVDTQGSKGAMPAAGNSGMVTSQTPANVQLAQANVEELNHWYACSAAGDCRKRPWLCSEHAACLLSHGTGNLSQECSSLHITALCLITFLHCGPYSVLLSPC